MSEYEKIRKVKGVVSALWDDPRRCTVTASDVAKHTDLTTTQAGQMLGVLEDEGYISKVARTENNTYRIEEDPNA